MRPPHLLTSTLRKDPDYCGPNVQPNGATIALTGFPIYWAPVSPNLSLPKTGPASTVSDREMATASNKAKLARRTRERFRRRKNCLLKKGDELAKLCCADVFVYIKKNEKVSAYRSEESGDFPPPAKDIVSWVCLFLIEADIRSQAGPSVGRDTRTGRFPFTTEANPRPYRRGERRRRGRGR